MDIGRVVCSLSGHDKGFYMVVVGKTAEGLLVCNGKQRRKENPKLKNEKHLLVTEYVVAQEWLQTNKSIRRSLYDLLGKYKEEDICQKEI